ncbi:MAG: HlyD family type I secretion periplasmic adaptor subunit [Pseudomonadota bacterium]
MKLISHHGLASDVITHDVSPLTVNTDPGAYVKLGWIIVLGGVLGFLLWASLAPLDKGVPLSGSVAMESNRKAIQHLGGGTIDAILVKEGDSVKAGQVLVRMNSVSADAQADMTRVQYFSARAVEARLLAERDGKDGLAFPAALESARSDARVAQNMALQAQLFGSRRAALQSELGALDQNIAGVKLQAAGITASRDGKRLQLAILDEQLASLRDLSRDGYVPRSRLLDLERSQAQTAGALAEDEGNIGRAQRQVAELGLRRSQRVQEFQRDVRNQLSDVQKEAGSLGSRMKAEDYTVQNVDLKAPVDGVVMGVNVFTRGGVVAPGFKLMDVVPTGDALVVEGHLPVNLVDRVHPGLPVQLIFAAFNASKTPQIAGQITTVSADRLVDDKTGAPYYRVSARVTPAGQKMIAQHKLEVRPGMPVELFVKTGERTMMSYLLKPVFDRAQTSMTEE